jgi:ornithine--oxo-acid transaminase
MELSSKDFQELDEKYGAHNYHPIPVVITKAEGIWVWDVEGNRYIDCLSAYSSQNMGHRHPKIIQALKDQADRVTLTSRAFANDKMGLFLKKLCNIMGPHIHNPTGGPIMALPMNTGVEAVETALKVSRAWGYLEKKIPKGEAHIIVCDGNFHGRTITVVGFSSDIVSGQYNGNFGPFTPNFHNIPYGNTKQLKNKVKELGAERVAAFLFEPIQGEAGVIIPPDGWLKQTREICTKNNILMVADEIQTGLCRTGDWFACDHEKVQPDIFCLGKALGGGIFPVSAVVTRADVIGPKIITPGVHGSTFGGNPLGSMIALAALEVLEEEKLVERARSLGSYFKRRLLELQQKSDVIVDVRGRGLLLAIELNTECRPYTLALKDAGVLAKETHDSPEGGSIRFAPPLIISQEEIDQLYGTIEQVFT